MSNSKQLLFVALHRPGRSPSQRFRFEQFVPYLEKNGWQCDYAYMLDEQDDKAFYTPGAYFSKARIVLKGFKKRISHLSSAADYDVIFIQRESFVSGSTYFERRFAKKGAKIVFDFDDAIWMLDISDANKNLSWLKDPSKTKKIISISDHVIAGNKFLAEYALQFNETVSVIPTVVDTEYYQSKFPKSNGSITIGWTGSQTTNKHFELAAPFLRTLKEKYGDMLRIAAVTEREIEIDGVDVDFIRWDKEREIENLDQIDIGIMPLPKDEWSRGKCGFKGIQYMSLGKPSVMSPVGVNPEIVTHGVNGFLPESDEQWVDYLTQLIDYEDLRNEIGQAGRKTIEEKYSVNATQDQLLSLLDSLVD